MDENYMTTLWITFWATKHKRQLLLVLLLTVTCFSGVALHGCNSGLPSNDKKSKTTLVIPIPGNGDLDPRAESLVSNALSATQQRDFTAARKMIELLVPVSAESADLSERMASIYREMGDVDLALQYANQAVRIAPKSPSALLVLSVIESDLDWPANVGQRLQEAITLAPSSVEPRLALAKFLQATGNLIEAEKQYHALIEMDDSNPGGWGMLAAVLHQQNRYVDARRALDEAARRSSEANPSVWVLRAKIDIDEAASGVANADAIRKQAKANLEEGVGINPVPSGLFVLGALLESEGDFVAAKVAMEKAYKGAPEIIGLRPKLGRLRIRLGAVAQGEALISQELARVTSRDRLTRAVNRSGADLADPERHRAVARECDERKMVARGRLEWGLVLKAKPADGEAKRRLTALRAEQQQ